jgi:hypothetical protein
VLHACRIVPVRVGRDDAELRVRAVRVVGYRFICSCGARGKSRAAFAIARLDAREHRAHTAESEGVASLD